MWFLWNKPYINLPEKGHQEILKSRLITSEWMGEKYLLENSKGKNLWRPLVYGTNEEKVIKKYKKLHINYKCENLNELPTKAKAIAFWEN